MIWALLLIAAIVVAPFLGELSRKKMTDATRRNAPGQFADLSQGKTHYTWAGPDTGPVCVCVHGLTTPSFVWQGLVPYLTAMGCRTLTYDLYGRGYSDRKAGAQNDAFFVRQLNDLLSDQNVTDDITLIGYSMGGAISASYAARHGDRVKDLILLAPAGMQTVGNDIARFCASTPGLGAWMMLSTYPSALRKGFRSERDLPTSVPHITDLQENELRYQGFLPAVLSSLKNMLKHPLTKEHKHIAATGLPVLAIWGAEDSVIPLSASDTLAGWNASARQEVIAGAGHGLTYTHTDDVAGHIKDFVQDQV